MTREASARTSGFARRVGRGVAALGAIGAAGFSWGVWEARWFEVRRVTVPVLPAGARPIRILHVSDMHVIPRQRRKQDFVARLAGLQPDLVINTGDNLGSAEGVEVALGALDRLLDVPGVFVFGSNDYYGPRWKNPFSYFGSTDGHEVDDRPELPWDKLRDTFVARGWHDLNHHKAVLDVAGMSIEFRGTDDAHLGRDDYLSVAGPVPSEVDLGIGVTHAPYARVVDSMIDDGCALVFAGHTHGGQVCVPGYGALVSNCDLPPGRAAGLSVHPGAGRRGYLHVSGGLGTSPLAPFRFACRPSATLVTLTTS
ncbi:metallophosphoesterase [Enemella sp. A6]|uniref:metallophosphoesterase n=1 Tax=Enemella sp. A6 TaxID=3440152 RepID=UPI003EB82AD5